MLPTYFFANVDIRDPEQYADYRRQVSQISAQFGASYICRGGKFDLLEGDGMYDRLTIMKFPTWDNCRTWYHSKEYGRVKSIRQASSRGNLFMTEGLPGDAVATPGAGLVLAMGTVHDQETYKEYQQATRQTLTASEGIVLAAGGRVARLEGAEPQQKIVLLSFPSYQAAKDWYQSPEYRSAMKLRQASTDSMLLIAEAI